MKKIGVALLALAALIAAMLMQTVGTAQQSVSIGVDADPTGNTATGLGPIDQCVSVQNGDTFSVDVFVSSVTDLLAWEVYFSYDGSIVNVVDRDLQLFQAADDNSEVFDASESLPSSGGLYRLGAVDLGQPSSPNSGSGVLARLTLKAVGAGISPTILITLDANNDGRPDLGTRLRAPDETPIGDTNGDVIFDGTVFNAQIAVDRDCPPGTEPTVLPSPATASPTSSSGTTVASPTATEAPSGTTGPRQTATPAPSSTPDNPDGSDGNDWNSPVFMAAYVAAGAVAVIALAGVALLGIRRRRF
jgi:hypothetical protein